MEYIFRVSVENKYGVGEGLKSELIVVKYLFGKCFKVRKYKVKRGFEEVFYYKFWIIYFFLDVFDVFLFFNIVDVRYDLVFLIWIDFRKIGGFLIIGN